ncbi:MAG: LicD family protein [Tannerella sp.]|jgi:lipopolysaccharide cholinephosphotransferase|nr:LicD family protein [Tannerella sp.]
MKSVDIVECHRVLLSIAVEFDRICRKYGMPYYMIGGTMLGAVRHQGFIPWDDDMDFGVPRVWFDRLPAILSAELPPHLRVWLLNKPDVCTSNFIKIDDSRTHLSYRGLEWITGLGINIDVFPLDDGLKTPLATRLFARYILLCLRLKDLLSIDPAIRRGFKKWTARTVRFLFPVSAGRLLSHVEKCIRKHAAAASGHYVNYYGAWGLKEVVDKKHFGRPREYPFDRFRFFGPAGADAYLTRLYGNYMELPPPEKRTSHTGGQYAADEDESLFEQTVTQDQDAGAR